VIEHVEGGAEDTIRLMEEQERNLARPGRMAMEDLNALGAEAVMQAAGEWRG
jgi:hypothetical protein